VRRRAAADPPAPDSELLSIPRLGRVRAEALAAAGVKSLDDLRNMTLDDLARIKWVGLGNAKLIKQWLETHDAATSETPAQPEPEPVKRTRAPRATSSSRSRAPRASDTTEPATAPRAPRRPRAPRATTTPSVEPAAEEAAMIPISQPVTIVESVEAYQPVVPSRRVDDAVARIKDAVPKKSREKKLGRQLKKVGQSVADAPASLGALSYAEKQAAFEAIDRIADAINAAVAGGKLSAKKQDALGAELKKLRKKLEKALGG
jgi:nucleotidyltransferase/DNA polymerase involved in DNA repair